jgi:hypothetical protein
MNARTRGTMVRVINDDQLSALLIEATGDVNASPTYSYALAKGKDGDLLICSEGVGYYFQDGEAPLSVTIMDGNTMSWLDATATLDELEELPTTEVDLADFVRVFGARLENNFWVWHGELAA